MNPNPGSIPKDLDAQATDLSKVAETSEKRRLEEEQQRAAAAGVVVKRWDAKMRKTFKGIISSPQRYRMMHRNAELRERGVID